MIGDDELFTRLIYFGTAHLGMTLEETWLQPFGFLLDLRECHLQWNGVTKPKKTYTLDDIF